MKPRVYIETTIVSYLTAWRARDIVTAGKQQVTREWWDTATDRFELVTSQLVVDEAGAGDAVAAQTRLLVLQELPIIEPSDDTAELSKRLVEQGAVPRKVAEDAAHIAIAVTNGIEFLLTWNCRHIANATKRSQIEDICRNMGFDPTIIVTPDHLMDNDHEGTI